MSEKKTRSKLGCLAIGCFGVMIAILAGSLILYFGAKYALNYALDEFTDDRPTYFTQSNLDTEESVTLKARFDDFKKRVNVNLPTKPLELGTDEINHLIETDPQFSTLKDKVRLNIVKNEVRGRISLPIDIIRQVYPDLPQMSALSGRFINADVAVNLWLRNGKLEAYLKDMRVKDKPMPSQIMEKIEERDLLKDDRIGGQLRQQFKQLRDVKVENGKIILIGTGGTVEELMNSRK